MYNGNYRFVEHPVHAPRPVYERSIAQVMARLEGVAGVQSVYQIGSVSTPGISDVDLVVVFDDGIDFLADPLDDLDGQEAYLFTHRLFGAPVSLFREAQPYTFFHNYRLLRGEPAASDSTDSTDDDSRQLRIQTALEYLLKMYITATVSRVFRVIKLRSLFLHVKAVRYDLEFLEATSGRLAELTDRLIGYRSTWFDSGLTTQAIQEDVRRFYDELKTFLEVQLAQYRFYLPRAAQYRIARSITLEAGRTLGFHHDGLVLPGVLSRMGRAYFGLQHRLNHFRFELPASTENLPEPVARHFEVAEKLSDYNRRHLPHFAPLTTSLNLL